MRAGRAAGRSRAEGPWRSECIVSHAPCPSVLSVDSSSFPFLHQHQDDARIKFHLHDCEKCRTCILKRRTDMIPLRFIVLVDFSVCGSCRKFCDNWVFRRHHSLPNTVRVKRKRTDIRKGRVEFFSQGIRNMLADGLYVTSEEFRHLLPIQPSRCAINLDFKPKRRIRLIDNNLTLIRLVARSLWQPILMTQIHAHIIPFSWPASPRAQLHAYIVHRINLRHLSGVVRRKGSPAPSQSQRGEWP